MEAPASGTFDICPVCFWEDDLVQLRDPDFQGGANLPSLRQAQANFLKVGASSTESLESVRKPTPEEARDTSWKRLV
jgi:hypothetical protein